MAELEIRVASERREGLLVELSRVVCEHGYALLRQRLTQDARGASLIMVLRGPDERQLALEDALSMHPRVLTFESMPHDSGFAHTSTDIAGARQAAAPARGATAISMPIVSRADITSVERVLPDLAAEYPRIFPLLINLGYALSPEGRDSSLYLAGRRMGSWVYQREFEPGATLGLAEAIKRIALPALRGLLVSVEMDKERLHIRNCPLCQAGGKSGGRFFCGFIEGLLAEPVASHSLLVRETSCHGNGARVCVFEISL